MSSIQVIPANSHLVSVENRKLLYAIIVKAYADTESDMWGESYVRVSEDEFNKYVHDGQILIAFYQGTVAGGLRVYRNTDNSFGFGMFGADFSLSGKGVGRALIEAAENIAISCGSERMRIEILRPRNKVLEIKKQLHDWYLRLGYLLVESHDFQEKFPDRARGILIPCTFDFYEKKLGESLS